MSSAARPFWLWLWLPAVTMSLGWGLRGYIGGGPLGAMIPGAMVALALVLLLDRDGPDAGLVAAFGAVGVGFGGQETYGQTVGLAMQPETLWWALAGFALKGAAWGLLGGACLAAALTGPRNRSTRYLSTGLLLMMAFTHLGWMLINQPKLIYFSNRVDKPREELWAGLILGGVAFVVWMTRRGWPAVTPFAGWGALGGGAGFALGAWLQVFGRHHHPGSWIDWWKIMELTFGALFGAALGWVAWRHRRECSERSPAPADPAPPGSWFPLLAAVLFAAALIFLEDRLPTRWSYTLIGAVALLAAWVSERAAWQIAITVTACAFTIDLLEFRPWLGEAAKWAAVALVTLGLAAWVDRRRSAFAQFLAITWLAVVVSVLKTYLPPGHWTVGAAAMEAVFVLMAVSASIHALRLAVPLSPGTTLR